MTAHNPAHTRHSRAKAAASERTAGTSLFSNLSFTATAIPLSIIRDKMTITKSFPNEKPPIVYVWKDGILSVHVADLHTIKVEGAASLQEALAIFKTINQR